MFTPLEQCFLPVCFTILSYCSSFHMRICLTASHFKKIWIFQDIFGLSQANEQMDLFVPANIRELWVQSLKAKKRRVSSLCGDDEVDPLLYGKLENNQLNKGNNVSGFVAFSNVSTLESSFKRCALYSC